MPDLLTHWGVLQDSFRLALADSAVSSGLKGIMSEQQELLRLGAISRAGGVFVPSILRMAREKWPREADGSQAKDRLAKKVAFALGGVAHYPADHFGKTLLKERAALNRDPLPTRDKPFREISAYYDIHVLRKVFMEPGEDVVSPLLLAANSSTTTAALEEFVRSLFQRALLAAHTFNPGRDPRQIDNWLDNLIDRLQPLHLDISLYVTVFSRPDPAKIRLFGVEDAFYSEADPAIRTARALQRQALQREGGAVAEVSAAVTDPGANTSVYGKSVALSLSLFREISLFWDGRTDEIPSVIQ